MYVYNGRARAHTNTLLDEASHEILYSRERTVSPFAKFERRSSALAFLIKLADRLAIARLDHIDYTHTHTHTYTTRTHNTPTNSRPGMRK